MKTDIRKMIAEAYELEDFCSSLTIVAPTLRNMCLRQ